MTQYGANALVSQPPTWRITSRRGWWEPNLGELWRFRELIGFFVWRDIKIRYKQTVIGAAWAVLQPFLAMVVFTIFFGRLAHIPSDGLPYPIFYYSALLPWMYFASSLQNATNTIVANQRIITKVYFPRLALPISAVLSGVVDFGVGMLLFVVMMIYYGIRPGYSFLLFPVFLLMAVLAALGIGLWLSAMNAVYRDVHYVVPFLIQFWLFASPVAYSSSLVPEKWRWLYGLNPLAGVIEGFRWSLSGKGELSVRLITVSAAIIGFFLITGLFYFQKMETTVADVV